MHPPTGTPPRRAPAMHSSRNAPDVIGAKSLHVLLPSRPRLQKLPMNPILIFADLLHYDRLFVKKPPDWFSSGGHSSDINASAIGSEVTNVPQG